MYIQQLAVCVGIGQYLDLEGLQYTSKLKALGIFLKSWFYIGFNGEFNIYSTNRFFKCYILKAEFGKENWESGDFVKKNIAFTLKMLK